MWGRDSGEIYRWAERAEGGKAGVLVADGFVDISCQALRVPASPPLPAFLRKLVDGVH